MSLKENTKKTFENIYDAIADITMMSAIIIGLPFAIMILQIDRGIRWYKKKVKSVYSQYEAKKAIEEYDYGN